MKVFILTEGGYNIGFGHITRCVSLSQAFKEKSAAPVLIVNCGRLAKSLLGGERHVFFNWLKKENSRALWGMIGKADLVIIDSYLAGLGFYKMVSEKVPRAAYIDDSRRLAYPKGVVINSTLYAKNLRFPEKKGVHYLLGSRYLPLRKEFWRLPEKKIRKEMVSVMVAFGGCDARSLFPQALRMLSANYPHLIKKIIIGKGIKKDKLKEIIKHKDKKTRLICHPGARKMKEAMLDADIAVSAAGQTLYEFLRVGVPTAGVCLAENQRLNLESLQGAGLVENAGWHNDKKLWPNLDERISRLSGYEARRQKSSLMRSVLDGKGSRRIADFLINGKKDAV